MAEAHQPESGVAVFCHIHVLLVVAAVVLDHLKHINDSLVRAPMQRPPQRRDTCGYRGEEVGLAAAHHAHGRRAAILLVIDMQNQQQVQRTAQDLWYLIRFGRHREHHMQEVFNVIQIVARINVRLSDGLLVSKGREGLKLCQQPDNNQVDHLRVHQVRVVG